MTKYQRGELMEGWNDCPIPVPTSSNGASSASATSKARKRMSRLPIVGGVQNSSESSTSNSSRSSLMPPIPSSHAPPRDPSQPPPQGSSQGSPSGFSHGPPPTSSIHPPPSRGVSKNTSSDVQSDEKVNVEECESRLRTLVESADISEKEKEFFTKRLVDAFPTLAPPHQIFISQIVDGLKAKESSGALKAQVLNYMMVNSGVSTWGVPLKKLVETFK